MTSSKGIAQVVGPALIAVTISEALNLDIWATNLAPVTYLNGCLLFIAGLSIVRVHNLWTRAWPVLITLTGWLAFFGGLYRMFAPAAPQGGRNAATYGFIGILFLIGVVLSIRGYSRSV